ncbi:DUF6183 family protein [Streptomyces sp. enrichment culture]|uniref:DUF6183 family protein n=1 Tax=Streptomyces sp. enrichment culture TaxID=1795815 RepID=UPI003F574F9B
MAASDAPTVLGFVPDWFHHDISDLAFAVLDPTRTRIAVLAATDTDAHRDAPGQREDVLVPSSPLPSEWAESLPAL